MALLSKSESKFETSLRITKAVKDWESSIVKSNSQHSRHRYIDSFEVMNVVYFELTREEDDDD